MYYDILEKAMQNNRGLIASELVNQILESLKQPPKPDKKVALGALLGSILTGIALKSAGASTPTALAGAFETAGGVIGPEVKKMEQAEVMRENVARSLLEPILKFDVSKSLAEQQEQEKYEKAFNFYKSLGYGDDEAHRLAQATILGLKQAPPTKSELEERRKAYETLAKEMGVPAGVLMENPELIRTYYQQRLKGTQPTQGTTGLDMSTLFRIYNEQDQAVKDIEKEIDKLLVEAAKTKATEGHLWWKHPSEWALNLKDRFENLRKQYLNAQLQRYKTGAALGLTPPLYDIKLTEAPNGSLFLAKVELGEGGIDTELAKKLGLLEEPKKEKAPKQATQKPSPFEPSTLEYARPTSEYNIEKTVDQILTSMPPAAHSTVKVSKETETVLRRIVKEILSKNINPWELFVDYGRRAKELSAKYPGVQWGVIINWLGNYAQKTGAVMP